jgi:hypothetical protein
MTPMRNDLPMARRALATDGAPHGAHHGAPHGAANPAVRPGAAPSAPSAPCPPALPGGHGGRKARTGAAHPGPHGTAHGAAHGAAHDADAVVARLEEAGRTLLALPHTGPSTKLRVSVLEVVHEAVAGGDDQGGRLRAAYPGSAQVSRMDEALGWLSRIPPDRTVLRRIVGARALVHPTTDKHLYPWRKLAAALGADHKAIQRWHAQGIALIVASLNAG